MSSCSFFDKYIILFFTYLYFVTCPGSMQQTIFFPILVGERNNPPAPQNKNKSKLKGKYLDDHGHNIWFWAQSIKIKTKY